MTTTILQTGAPGGLIHLVRKTSTTTLCERTTTLTLGVPWPRWEAALASLDVRQRPGCDRCYSLARAGFLLGSIK